MPSKPAGHGPTLEKRTRSVTTRFVSAILRFITSSGLLSAIRNSFPRYFLWSSWSRSNSRPLLAMTAIEASRGDPPHPRKEAIGRFCLEPRHCARPVVVGLTFSAHANEGCPLLIPSYIRPTLFGDCLLCLAEQSGDPCEQ